MTNISLIYGSVHGSMAFQMVLDAVTYVMAKSHHKMFAYIDEYIIIAHRDTATMAFNDLLSPLEELGLPISIEKLYPLQISYLGICANTLSKPKT